MSSPFDVAEQQLATTQANPFDIAQKGLNPFDVAEQTTKQSWGIETNPMMFLRSAGEGANVAATGLLNKLWELSQKVGLADPGYVDFNSPLGMVENSRRVGRLAMGRPNVAQMVPSEALVQNVISPPPVAKVGDPVFGSDIGVQPHFRLDDSLVGSLIGAMQTGQTPTTGQLVNEDVDPVNAFAGQNLRGLTTAGMGMMAPAFSQSAMAKVVPAAASWLAEAIPAATKLLFGGQIAAQAPETVAQSAATMGKLSTSEGRQQMANPLAEAAVAVGAPAVEGAILRQLAKAPATKPTVPTMGGVKDVIRPSDRDLMEGRIPPERQLPNFKTPFEQKVEAKLAQVPGPQPSTGGMIVTKEGGQGPVEGVTYRQTGPFTKEQQDALYEKVKKVFSDRDEYKKVIKNAPWLPSSAAGGYNKQLNEVSISSDNFKGKKQLLHTAQHEVLQKVFEQSRQELEQPFAEQFVRLPEKNKQAVEQYLQQAGYSYLDNSFDKVSELAGRFVTDRAKITPLVRESLRQLIGEKMFFLLDKERKTGDLFPKFAKEGETTYLNTGPFTKEQQDAMRQGAEKLLSSSRSISERNLPAANVEALRKGEEELRSGMALTSVRAAITPEVSGFTSPTRKIDAKQLVNRMTNILQQKAPVELQMLKDAGMDELAKRGQMSPEEFAQWAQENGPRVKVETYGMEGKVSEAKKERDKLNGELDTLPREQRNMLDTALDEYLRNPQLGKDYINPAKYGVSKEAWDKKVRILELDKQLENEPPDTSPRATSYYKQVSAFDTDAPMPEWTATKSGKNVQRVDVVIPYSGKVHKSLMGETPDKELRAEGILWRPDNLHENLPNTLGWAMVQYKTGPKGEKIGGMMEAQSRWGQKVAKQARATEENYANEIDWADVAREKARQTYKQVPLLRDYNRLIVKATIEQIKKEGGDHLFIPDAETAMMTEGHDLSGNVRRQGELVGPTYKTREEAESALERYETQKDTNENDKGLLAIVQQDRKYRLYYTRFVGPEQEPGMRLNYDTILPKIAEELTGSKGERVSLGEHKNAFEKLDRQAPNGDVVGYDKGKPRSNLIFRNADGTPKTDISGTMYELPKKTQMTSLTGKDTAKPGGEPQVQYRFSGPGPDPKDVEVGKKWLSGALEPLKGTAQYYLNRWSYRNAPQTSGANENVANHLVRFAVAKEAGEAIAKSKVTEVLGTHYRDPSFSEKLGRVIVQDNLNNFDYGYDKPGSPFKSENEFRNTLRDPEITAAIDRHRKIVQPEAETFHKEVGGKLAEPGKVTGTFINLEAIFNTDDVAAIQTALRSGSRVGDLTTPLKRGSVFGKERKGTGEAYELDYRTLAERMYQGNYTEAMKRRWYQSYVDAGLGVVLPPGKTPPTMGGKPMVRIPIERKVYLPSSGEPFTKNENLWVRQDLGAEARQALQTDSPVHRAGAQFMLDLATDLQIVGPTDFTYHVANMYSAIIGSHGAKTALGEHVRSVVGVRQMDLIARLSEQAYRVLKDTPEVQKEWAELSKIGAGRTYHQHRGLITSAVEKVGLGDTAARWLDPQQISSKVIQTFDKVGRLTLNKMFDNLVERGLETATESRRREFVSAMGQYHSALMSRFQQIAKDYRISPFVVAGRNFNRLGLHRVLLDPGTPGANPMARMKLQYYQGLKMLSTIATGTVLLNYLFTGKPLGRPGTTIGRVDTGKDNEKGLHIELDPMKDMLFSRGFRISGVQALAEGIAHEKPIKETAWNAARNIASGLYSPWAGPAVRLGETLFFGKSAGGPVVSENRDSFEENFYAAMKHVNPSVAAYIKGKEETATKSGGAKEVFKSLGSAIGVGTSRPLPMDEKVSMKSKELYPNEDVTSSLSKRGQIAKAISKEREPRTSEEMKRSMQYIAQKEAEVRKRLTKGLSEETQKRLDKLKIVVPGMKEMIRQGGADIITSDDEQTFMEQRLVAKYQKWFDTYLDTPAITSLSPNARNKYVVDHTKVLRKQAMNETKAAITKGEVTKR